MPDFLRLALDPLPHLLGIAAIFLAQHVGDDDAFVGRVGIEIERMVLDLDHNIVR